MPRPVHTTTWPPKAVLTEEERHKLAKMAAQHASQHSPGHWPQPRCPARTAQPSPSARNLAELERITAYIVLSSQNHIDRLQPGETRKTRLSRTVRSSPSTAYPG